MTSELPEKFIWGVATSAYQVEGGSSEAGKGESIWDRFAAQGRVPGAHLLGCDSLHRLGDDLDLLSRLGVGAYRFSVAWTRVMPEGRGELNPAGLDYYRQLVTGLKERGIEPFLTVYHWDLPQALQDDGGWANRATAVAYARFAAVLADHLGDAVTHWITHNEPWVAAMLGHKEGTHAPGISDWEVALRAGHNILISHGMGATEIRERVPGAKVGIALDCRPALPASDHPEDAVAAEHFDGYRNRWFFDPVFGKGYPEDMARAYVARGRIDIDSVTHAGDLDLVATPLDFLGLNYYTTIDVAAGSEESEDSGVPPGRNPPEGFTEMGWRIDPIGLELFLARISEEYQPTSILVTENGASYSDGPDEAGLIADKRRIDYVRRHVDAVASARAGGVPVDGYFVWSLLDNLEWTEGFSQRFGLVWVDHESAERIPKESFGWYSALIRSTTSGAF